MTKLLCDDLEAGPVAGVVVMPLDDNGKKETVRPEASVLAFFSPKTQNSCLFAVVHLLYSSPSCYMAKS